MARRVAPPIGTVLQLIRVTGVAAHCSFGELHHCWSVDHVERPTVTEVFETGDLESGRSAGRRAIDRASERQWAFTGAASRYRGYVSWHEQTDSGALWVWPDVGDTVIEEGDLLNIQMTQIIRKVE